MSNTYTYLNTERVSIVANTPAAATPTNHSRAVRLVGTADFFFQTTGDATVDTSTFVPAGSEVFVSLPINCPLSVMADAGVVGTNYVYITDVVKVL